MVRYGIDEKRRIRLDAALAEQGRRRPLLIHALGGRRIGPMIAGVVAVGAGVLFVVFGVRWMIRHGGPAVVSLSSGHPVVVACVVVVAAGFLVVKVVMRDRSGIKLSRATRRRYHV